MDDILEFDYEYELNHLIDEQSLADEQILPISKITTKSFRRFYLESQLLHKSIYTKQLINESPMRAPYSIFSMGFDDWLYNNTEAKDYINGKKGKLVGKIDHFGEVSIYEYEYIHPKDGNLIEYILIRIKSEIIIGVVRLITTKNIANKDIFLTNGLWNDQHSGKGMIFIFFTKWLLPKYNMIISDKATTISGENFWWKMIEYCLHNNKECGIYILADSLTKQTEEIIPLSNKKSFTDAWDKLGSIKRIYIKE